MPTATFLETPRMETPARVAVAKVGQRRQIQGLISQEFPGSNPGRRTPPEARGEDHGRLLSSFVATAASRSRFRPRRKYRTIRRTASALRPAGEENSP